MSNEYLYSVTVEEAVALLINLDHVPVGKSVLEVVTTAHDSATEAADKLSAFFKDEKPRNLAETAGTLFESFFLHIREQVTLNRSDLASSLFTAFESEMKRPEISQLVQVNLASAVPRFTVESVNRWASANFGLHIPGLARQKQESLFYQVPRATPDEGAVVSSISDAAAAITQPQGDKKISGGLGKTAVENLYVTMAFLTEMFINKRSKWLLPDGTINISQTAETIAEHIAKDPVAKDVGGQGIEAIKNRLEAAQEAKRVKVNRL